MAGFQDIGTFSYNGYSFTNALHLTVKTEPVEDEAGRVVIYNRHTITVETVISADGDSTGASLEEIIEKLSQHGGKLIFTGKGFLDIVVNDSVLRDVDWGPKTQVLSWEPVGSAQACLVTWSVVACIPVCQRTQGVMALNYSVSYSIDESGDTTRTIEGYLQIAQTRYGGSTARSSRLVPESADAYLTSIVVDPMNGFKRTQTRNLSKDKSRLDFTITDRQIPTNNPYPPDCIDIRLTHSVDWSVTSAVRGRGTFNCSITLKPQVNGLQAWIIFLQLVIPRLVLMRQRTNKAIMVDGISATEEMFGREHSFRLSYQNTTCIERFLYDSALWEPTPTNWNIWRASLQNSMFHPRGNAGLENTPDQDILVDLCGGGPTATADTYFNRYDPPTRALPIVAEIPPAEKSWLRYKQDLITKLARHVQKQTFQQEPEANPEAGAELIEHGQPIAGKDFELPPKDGEDDLITVGGQGTVTVCLEGHGKRVGHKIPRPAVIRIGSQVATEIGGVFSQSVASNAFGIPVYEAAWRICYEVPNSPEVIPPPDDKKECVNGETGDAKKPQ